MSQQGFGRSKIYQRTSTCSVSGPSSGEPVFEPVTEQDIDRSFRRDVVKQPCQVLVQIIACDAPFRTQAPVIPRDLHVSQAQLATHTLAPRKHFGRLVVHEFSVGLLPRSPELSRQDLVRVGTDMKRAGYRHRRLYSPRPPPGLGIRGTRGPLDLLRRPPSLVLHWSYSDFKMSAMSLFGMSNGFAGLKPRSLLSNGP